MALRWTVVCCLLSLVFSGVPAGRALGVEVKTERTQDEDRSEKQSPPASEHHEAEASRRIGLFVGISQHADSAVPRLRSAVADARSMAGTATGSAAVVDEAIVLCNQEASRAAVETAICERLPAMSQPGDTVLIYWSGHCGRMADENGDEASGYDEYLLPFDCALSDRNQAILDEAFAKWLRHLRGRDVWFIVDTVHAGGFDDVLQAAGEEGPGRVRLLAACDAGQVALEREKPPMTSYFTGALVEYMRKAGRRLNLALAARAVHAALEVERELNPTGQLARSPQDIVYRDSILRK